MKKRAYPPGLPPAGEVPQDPNIPPKASADNPYIALRKSPRRWTLSLRQTKGGWTIVLLDGDAIVFETPRGYRSRVLAQKRLEALDGMVILCG